MTHYIILLLICELAGLVMICGGIVLLYQQKIRLDAITKEIQVDVPFFGKMRTNAPAITLFVLGFIPLMYPLQFFKTEYVKVRQTVKSDDLPVAIYAVVAEHTLNNNGEEFQLAIPVVASDNYSPQLIYVAHDTTVAQRLSLDSQKGDVLELQPQNIQRKGRTIMPAVRPDIQQPPENFR
jgi:hypothetical protein